MRKAISAVAEATITTALGIEMDRQGFSDRAIAITIAVCIAVILLTIFWPKKRRQQAAALPWSEIERRFKELDERLRTAQDRELGACQIKDVNQQWVWWVYGGTEPLRDEAKQLCEIAGRRLLITLNATGSARAKRTHKDLDRWLWFLVDTGLIRHEDRLATSRYERGKTDEQTYEYNTRHLLDASISACLECIKREA